MLLIIYQADESSLKLIVTDKGFVWGLSCASGVGECLTEVATAQQLARELVPSLNLQEGFSYPESEL